ADDRPLVVTSCVLARRCGGLVICEAVVAGRIIYAGDPGDDDVLGAARAPERGEAANCVVEVCPLAGDGGLKVFARAAYDLPKNTVLTIAEPPDEADAEIGARDARGARRGSIMTHAGASAPSGVGGRRGASSGSEVRAHESSRYTCGGGGSGSQRRARASPCAACGPASGRSEST
ncbi:MAG: hypothetical protein VXW27_10225, partial [Pseudomonadota bacterium]|nr:hypothetical protein [Pseudomonadota bacterium]